MNRACRLTSWLRLRKPYLNNDEAMTTRKAIVTGSASGIGAATVLALSKNAARSLASQGISVNCVAPGATLTPMIAQASQNDALREKIEGMAVQNCTAEPREIATNIVYLLSPQASYVTGATLVADGGLTMY